MVYEKYETFDFKFGKSIYVVEQKPHKPIVIEIVHNLEYGLLAGGCGKAHTQWRKAVFIRQLAEEENMRIQSQS